MVGENMGKRNILMTFNLAGGYPHPDPRHLGSRLYGKARILEYEKTKIVMTVKPQYVSYVYDYVISYMRDRKVDVMSTEQEETSVYEHQTVYDKR